MGWPRRVATAISSVGGLVLVAWVVLTVVTPTLATLTLVSASLVIAATSCVLGVLITRRQPDSMVGLWLATVGFTTSMVTTKEIGIRVLATHEGLLDRWVWLVAVLNENVWAIFAAVGVLLVYFPDGRLPSRRWRPVPPALIICAVIQQTAGAFNTEPFRAPLSHVRRPSASHRCGWTSCQCSPSC